MPILESQAFALPTSHRIDNARKPTPARTIYNKVYSLRDYNRALVLKHPRTYPRRRFVVICLLWLRNLRDSWFTTTDVRKRLSYIRDRPPPTSELTCDGAKLRKFTIRQNLLKEKCFVPPVFCLKQYKKLSPLEKVHNKQGGKPPCYCDAPNV